MTDSVIHPFSYLQRIPSSRSCRCRSSSSSSMSPWLQLLVVLAVFGPPSVNTIRIHSIHWNSSNPIFRIDNTDNIVDVNEGNLPWEYDQLNIVCPWYREGTREGDQEKYIIYNVSKEEYETCRINQQEPRIVAVCNQPDRQQQFTITFRSFSPSPQGLEFSPGQDYYFISTSSPGDLYRRWGGSCSTHNMKVIFKVAHPLTEAGSRNSGVGGGGATAINSPRHKTGGGLVAGGQQQAAESHQQLPTNSDNRYVRPIEDVRSFQRGVTAAAPAAPADSGGYSGRKRNSSPVKQEASTMSASCRVSGGLLATLLLVVVSLLQA